MRELPYAGDRIFHAENIKKTHLKPLRAHSQNERIHIALDLKEILLDFRDTQPISKRPWTMNFCDIVIENTVIKNNSSLLLHFNFLYLILFDPWNY